jgi:hypothetical protein
VEAVLGKLVQFENRKGSGTPRTGAGLTEGQILIFTGVRYERDTGANPPKPTATSSGGKRKRG